MRRQRRTGTACERALRTLLWHRGFRYRVDYKLPIPGLRRRADIAFPGARVAVFVDGCFWHRCPEHGTNPANNADWWERKLSANVARDADTDRRLAELGWTVLRVWEHETGTDAEAAADRVAGVVRSARAARTTRTGG